MAMKFEDPESGMMADEALDACRDGYLRCGFAHSVTSGYFGEYLVPSSELVSQALSRTHTPTRTDG